MTGKEAMAEQHDKDCLPGHTCVECDGCDCGLVGRTCDGPGCYSYDDRDQWRDETGYSEVESW